MTFARTAVEVDADDLDIAGRLAVLDRVMQTKIAGFDSVVTGTADYRVLTVTGGNVVVE